MVINQKVVNQSSKTWQIQKIEIRTHRIKENQKAEISQNIVENTEKNGLMRMRFQRDVDQTYYLVRTDTITKDESNIKKKNDYLWCEQCGQGYDSKEILTSHILQQHDSNPF